MDYGDYGDADGLSFDDGDDSTISGTGRSGGYRISSGRTGPESAPLSSLFTQTHKISHPLRPAAQPSVTPAPKFVDKTAAAKARALRALGGAGMLAPPDPNSSKDSTRVYASAAAAAAADSTAVVDRKAVSPEEAADARKRKMTAAFGSIDVNSDAGKKLLSAESRNAELAERAKRQKRESLFAVMEKREDAAAAVETITKTIAKVFCCTVCHSTREFPSEICRSQKHPYTTRQATKRYFECSGCRRQATYVLVPLLEPSCYSSHCTL